MENNSTYPFVHVHRLSTEASTYLIHPNHIDIFLQPCSGYRVTRVYLSDTGHLWMHAVIFLAVCNEATEFCHYSKTLLHMRTTLQTTSASNI